MDLNFIFGHIFLFESFAGHVTGKCVIELVTNKRHFSCFLRRQAIGVKVCPPESFAHRHAPKVTRPAEVREIKGVKVWNQNNPQIWAKKRVMTGRLEVKGGRGVLWAVLVLYGSLHVFLKGNICRNPNTLKVDWMNSCWAHTDIKRFTVSRVRWETICLTAKGWPKLNKEELEESRSRRKIGI